MLQIGCKLALELRTEPSELAAADDGTGEEREGGVDVGPAPAAHGARGAGEPPASPTDAQ